MNFDYSNDNKKMGSSDFNEKSGEMRRLEQYLDDTIKINENQLEEVKEIRSNFKSAHPNTPDISLDHRKGFTGNLSKQLVYIDHNNQSEDIEELMNKSQNMHIDEEFNEEIEKNYEVLTSNG